MVDASSKKVTDTGKPMPPNAGKGRPKGALNKNTAKAKDAIALAAEKLGGAERLVAWAQEDPLNERVFWGTIYPKLLPLQAELSGADGSPFAIQIIRFGAKDDDGPATE
jgi:hypothetical protein